MSNIKNAKENLDAFPLQTAEGTFAVAAPPFPCCKAL